jgi:hypothetical protein
MMRDMRGSGRETNTRTDFLPRDEWRPYMRAVVTPERRVSTERKTGLEPAVRSLRVRDGGLEVLRPAA